MPKKIFFFDIDLTLLVAGNDRQYLDFDTPVTSSVYNPYSVHGYAVCNTIQKDAMRHIFTGILRNEDEIGFITSGELTKDQILTFVKLEYGIVLPDNTAHYNRKQNPQWLSLPASKVHHLTSLARQKGLHHDQIYLIDDSEENLYAASQAGFSTIHADTCEFTSGVLYISKLQDLLLTKPEISIINFQESWPHLKLQFEEKIDHLRTHRLHFFPAPDAVAIAALKADLLVEIIRAADNVSNNPTTELLRVAHECLLASKDTLSKHRRTISLFESRSEELADNLLSSLT